MIPGFRWRRRAAEAAEDDGRQPGFAWPAIAPAGAGSAAGIHMAETASPGRGGPDFRPGRSRGTGAAGQLIRKWLKSAAGAS